MPYIIPDKRPEIDALIAPVCEFIAMHATPPGDCNYLLTKIILAMIHDHDGVSYAKLEAVVGRLNLVLDELKRRLVHPYEDRKRMLNGDVF